MRTTRQVDPDTHIDTCGPVSEAPFMEIAADLKIVFGQAGAIDSQIEAITKMRAATDVLLVALHERKLGIR